MFSSELVAARSGWSRSGTNTGRFSCRAAVRPGPCQGWWRCPSRPATSSARSSRHRRGSPRSRSSSNRSLSVRSSSATAPCRCAIARLSSRYWRARPRAWDPFNGQMATSGQTTKLGFEEVGTARRSAGCDRSCRAPTPCSCRPESSASGSPGLRPPAGIARPTRYRARPRDGAGAAWRVMELRAVCRWTPLAASE